MAVVLLIDDREDSRFIYSTLLRHRGHTCYEAENGAAGLSLAHEVNPGIILLDLAMPVMDGWETILALRLSEATSRIPVVALTAYASPEHEVRAREAGFNAYIRKPAKPSVVVTLVEELLQRDVEIAPTIIQI